MASGSRLVAREVPLDAKLGGAHITCPRRFFTTKFLFSTVWNGLVFPLDNFEPVSDVHHVW